MNLYSVTYQFICDFSPAQSAFGKLIKVLMAAFILRELFVRLRIIMCVVVTVDVVVDDLEKKKIENYS